MAVVGLHADLDAGLLARARDLRGFLPDSEGRALAVVALEAARVGPLLEIGSYCGKSALYLGAAARAAGTVVFSIDHHHGSAEQQPGWEHHDPAVVDAATGRIDTLPWFRRAVLDAGLDDVVITVVGDSVTVASYWGRPLGLCFVDGGHALDVVRADYQAWRGHVASGGYLAFHDVFEDPVDGGQAPYEVWCAARSSGEFEEWSSTGSLRVLRRRS
jgi:predicted O-methyltransferase YrrM